MNRCNESIRIHHPLYYVDTRLEKINIDDIEVFVLRKPIKHLYLRISAATGQVEVSVPKNLSLKKVQEQIKVKEHWIKNKLSQWSSSENVHSLTRTDNAKLHHLALPLLQQWAKTINVEVNFFGIRLMKTRWGSCNTTKHRIWINLSLLLKPIHCLEYVIVHELIHLLEPSHNARFYQLMSHYLPDWQERKRLLNNMRLE